MSHTATIAWFAGHEFRLAWRDWWWMMTAGRHSRARVVTAVLAGVAIFMHLIAWSMVARYADAVATRTALVVITGSLLLSFSLMLSQAMESVTRAFYARADLDLILSAPVEVRRVFSVRIAALALSVTLLGLALAAPFINVLVLNGGARWLAAYGIVAAMGFVATATAVALTVLMFRLIGPKRTRLVAQVVAAVIGAAFIIGLQVGAILSYGTLSRVAVLESDWFVANAPAIGSVLWLPARAVTGDLGALGLVVGASLAALAVTVVAFSSRFGEHAIAAAGVAQTRNRRRRAARFRAGSPMRALRRKEWVLLRRDPWLMSQSLMQLLYLLPPALLLWKSFAGGTGAVILIVPVLVMAAGQLAGGLAWLAISGEDAPDLVATAPVPAPFILRAKVEAVMAVIAVVFAPFVAALAFRSPDAALTAAAGIAASAGAATAIQLWFRTQAKRSHFRRRQISSRVATFAEAFSSITWAGTAALAAAGTWLAMPVGLVAAAILLGTRILSPRRG